VSPPSLGPLAATEPRFPRARRTSVTVADLPATSTAGADMASAYPLRKTDHRLRANRWGSPSATRYVADFLTVALEAGPRAVVLIPLTSSL
jgi:hypothetical protein